MTVRAWRISKRKHAKKAFTGEGARRYGGRWNSPGIAMVYTAESQALAALELLVHLDSPELFSAYVLLEVRIDESLIEVQTEAELPRNWRDQPVSHELRAVGDAWVRDGRSAVLKVPSVVVPSESNYLLNPAHPEFSKISMGPAVDFSFDRRIVKPRGH